MRVKAYIKKGIAHQNGVCEDTILADGIIVKDNYIEKELGEYFVVGVADGVGGQNAGEVASGFTMLRLVQVDAKNTTVTSLVHTLQQINQEIKSLSVMQEAYRGKASTLTILGKVSDGIMVANVGNSRLYQFLERQGIKQLHLETTDNTMLNDWISNGEPEGRTIEGIIGTPEADILTGYMGMNETMFDKKLKVYSLDISKTKRILITSDGIHNYLSYEDIKNFICSDNLSENVFIQLAQKAIENGSKDDLSILVIEFVGDGSFVRDKSKV